MEDIKRILVVSRMTKECQKAVHYGISLARQYGAELSIIHVVHNPFGLKGWNLPMVSLEKEYQKILEDSKTDLDKIVRNEQARGLAIKELIVNGEPTEEILKTVKHENIDLLIMLVHEKGWLDQVLFGRTIEDLVQKMPCSVLLVKK